MGDHINQEHRGKKEGFRNHFIIFIYGISGLFARDGTNTLRDVEKLQLGDQAVEL